MTKFLIASHGELAKGFTETLQMIIGSDTTVSYYCMAKDKSGDMLESDLRNIMYDWRENSYVVFTDLMGGSVNNILTTMLLSGMQFELITGMNLALVIGLVISGKGDVKSIQDTIEEAKSGIIHVNKILRIRGENV